MSKIVTDCPACGEKLKITSMRCTACDTQLQNEFEFSLFDALSVEQMDFLTTFLKRRGNMTSVQNELGISYPTAKKRLDDLLVTLELAEEEPQEEDEEVDMSGWQVRADSKKASDIVRRKLMRNHGRVVVHTTRGLPCKLRVAPDGVSFLCDKLPVNPPYRYEVFDVIVELLLEQGGRARKGNGRNYRLGEPECDKTTVVGAIGYRYAHAEDGKAVYDPVFVLAAVLEWAGIARNERGELVLTEEYLDMLKR